MAKVNWGLRCGQLLAERADIKRMNIIERTALWYRLERIGAEPKEEPQLIFEDIEWSSRQWDVVQQLQGQVRFLSSKVNEIRANASKKSKQYKYK